jgi:hypothetical protein
MYGAAAPSQLRAQLARRSPKCHTAAQLKDRTVNHGGAAGALCAITTGGV